MDPYHRQPLRPSHPSTHVPVSGWPERRNFTGSPYPQGNPFPSSMYPGHQEFFHGQQPTLHSHYSQGALPPSSPPPPVSLPPIQGYRVSHQDHLPLGSGRSYNVSTTGGTTLPVHRIGGRGHIASTANLTWVEPEVYDPPRVNPPPISSSPVLRLPTPVQTPSHSYEEEGRILTGTLMHSLTMSSTTTNVSSPSVPPSINDSNRATTSPPLEHRSPTSASSPADNPSSICASTNSPVLSGPPASNPLSSQPSIIPPSVETLDTSVQQSRGCLQAQKPRMGASERNLKNKASAERLAKLTAMCQKLLDDFHERIEKIAEECGISSTKVRETLGFSSKIKSRRKNNDWNTLVKAKGKEVNADRDVGDKLKVPDIAALVKNDKELMALRDDPEAMMELKNALEEDEDREATATRISKKAIAARVKRALDQAQQHFDHTADATDMSGFGIMSRSRFDQTIAAGFVGVGPVDDFLRSHFKVGIWQFVHLWESFSVQQNMLGAKGLSSTQMTTMAVKLIREGLQIATGINNVKMNYINYRTDIVSRYKVKIVDWPEEIPFKSPSDMCAEDAKAIYHLWKSGVAHWERLTSTEYKRHMRAIERDEANGVQVRVPRQSRSDKGKKRKPRVNGAQSGDAEEDDIDESDSDGDSDNGHEDSNGTPTLDTQSQAPRQNLPLQPSSMQNQPLPPLTLPVQTPIPTAVTQLSKKRKRNNTGGTENATASTGRKKRAGQKKGGGSVAQGTACPTASKTPVYKSAEFVVESDVE
ncbi:hypothetical protein VKT23_020267 [Stygiomarasmius scandens]|uniref:Uncharacterized protein n=1 Tax=Marasmiellus scandens TaxID=2682957 RepID=A0ABR1IME3_9AGAR